jgi:hypothetical protein
LFKKQQTTISASTINQGAIKAGMLINVSVLLLLDYIIIKAPMRHKILTILPYPLRY